MLDISDDVDTDLKQAGSAFLLQNNTCIKYHHRHSITVQVSRWWDDTDIQTLEFLLLSSSQISSTFIHLSPIHNSFSPLFSIETIPEHKMRCCNVCVIILNSFKKKVVCCKRFLLETMSKVNTMMILIWLFCCVRPPCASHTQRALPWEWCWCFHPIRGLIKEALTNKKMTTQCPDHCEDWPSPAAYPRLSWLIFSQHNNHIKEDLEF